MLSMSALPESSARAEILELKGVSNTELTEWYYTD
jgi:hypothetical protein